MIKQNFEMLRLMHYPIKQLQDSWISTKLLPELNIQTKNQNEFSLKNIQNLTKFHKTDKKIQLQKQNFHSIFIQIEKLYKEFKLDQAYKKWKYFQKQLRNHNYEQNSNYLIYCQMIQDQYRQMIKYHNLIPINLKKAQFKFDRQENGIIMHYRFPQAQKGSVVQFHIQKQFNDLSIQTFLSVSNQIILYPKCLPFNQQTKQLKIIQINKKIGKTTLHIPPLQKQNCYFLIQIYDRLKESNSIFFCCRKIQSFEANKKFDCDKILNNFQKGIINYQYCLLQYLPIQKNKVKIKMLVCLGVDLPFLFKFIIKSTIRTFCSEYFKNLQNVSKNFKSSDWQTNMKKNPQLYELFNQKVIDKK